MHIGLYIICGQEAVWERTMKTTQLTVRITNELDDQLRAAHEKFCKETLLKISLNSFAAALVQSALNTIY
jgi:hypothetical protein